MSALRTFTLTAAALLCMLCVSCSPKLAGGTDTETGGTVTGCIKKSDGSAASQTAVTLVPADYNPAVDKPLPDSLTDTTNDDGLYSVHIPARGGYDIQAVSIASRDRLLLCGIACSESVVNAPTASLVRPGSIRVYVPEGIDPANAYAFIPGTKCFVALRGGKDFAVIDSVPACVVPSVVYASFGDSSSPIIRYVVTVFPGKTTDVYNPQWKYAHALELNTSASGAGVASAVAGFPVLIRLNGNNFDFSQAKSGGEDIRFTKQDNTPLPYEIERWNAVDGRAEIWVKVDTVYGNDSAQSIMIYWGNPGALGSSNGPATFDTTDGFQGVWHMAQPVNTIAPDATANRYDGTPSDTAPFPVLGAIGIAQEFNGTSNAIRMKGTASGALNFLANGRYTVSAWVYSDTLDEQWRLIVGKGHEQYYLKQQLKSRYGNWEFVEYHDKSAWEIAETPVTIKTWKYLSGARDGDRQYLYLDGKLIDSTVRLNPDTIPRSTSEDVTIGKYQNNVEYNKEGYCFFDGKIDEVRISSVARSADWIKLCFMNQREDDRLVVFK